jgi:enoyl-CoA hydratase/carnithine racemase
MTKEPAALIETDGDGVATISLNRPERLNAWSVELGSTLLEVLRQAEADPAVKGVVLTGKGRAFSAGADLKDPDTHRIDSIEAFLQSQAADRGRPMFDCVSSYKKPILCAVSGYAIGIGCLVPLCCDFIYAGHSAKFQLTQVALGIMPAYGGALRLARAVGKLNASEMILTGRMIEAQEALTWGMVSRLFPDDELLKVSQDTMRAIVGKPTHAVSFARESIRVAVDSNHMRSAELSDAYRFMILSQLQDSKKQHEAWRKGR